MVWIAPLKNRVAVGLSTHHLLRSVSPPPATAAVGSQSSAVRGQIQTDMSPGELLAVAFSALTIEPSHLKQAVLEPPLVRAHRRADGAAVQLPQ
jgi:hypothetical protein